MSRRALLEHNSGEWHGLFIRLDHAGVEQTRFNTVLRVHDEADQVVAALTDCSTGQTRTMRFGELPTAMQVDPAGHWSLGPDPFTPWNWNYELCLTVGQQRRRLIVRGNSGGLHSLVMVQEARAGIPLEEPETPLRCSIESHGDRHCWSLQPDLQMLLDGRNCSLQWQQTNGTWLAIKRHYGADGALLALPSAAAAGAAHPAEWQH